MAHWLIIGGTRFLGHHIADAATKVGHRVTLLHRGSTPSDLSGVEEILADRDGGLAALGDRRWDAVIDVCGYLPRVVAASAEALRTSVAHYTFISTISVYPDRSPEEPPIREDDPVRGWNGPETEVIDELTYGALKVRCEDAVREVFPAATVIRPGYIVGPRDPTARFSWWVRRLAAGGRVLVPDSPDLPLQVVDVRDLADFVVRATEKRLAGFFNVVGPVQALTWGALFASVARMAPAPSDPVAVDEDWLVARLGPHDEKEEPIDEILPMWLPRSRRAESLIADHARAMACGLVLRPLEQTLRDLLAAPEPLAAAAKQRLTPEIETRLLQEWMASSASGFLTPL